MPRYVIADEGGEIVRTVICDENQASTQAQAGETMLESADASAATHYVAGGELAAYTEEQAEAKAARPHPRAAWDNSAMAWVDPRTLSDLKAAKLAEMKTARDAQQFGGFVWDGSPFASDERSQSVLLGMFTTAFAGLLPDTPFRLQDNSWRVLTPIDVMQVWGALRSLIAGAFAQFAAREAAIEAATTKEQVEGIAWP